jgi:hypothetical protein
MQSSLIELSTPAFSGETGNWQGKTRTVTLTHLA